MKQKIIFLDIDGVLNSHRSWMAYNHLTFDEIEKINKHELDPVAVGNLHRIITETGSRVVISSAWRITLDLEALRDIFEYYGWEREWVIDVTPRDEHRAHRGTEIEMWMMANVESFTNFKYAIIDDDSDMLDWQKKRHVHTQYADGLLFKHYEQLQELLK